MSALPPELPAVLGAPRLALPPAISTTLPNGLELRVLVREGVPLVGVRLMVHGGRSDDDPSRPGFADLFAAALAEGSTRRTGAAIAEALQEAGASLETAADEDTICLSATALAGRERTLLDVLGEIVTSPGFRLADVTRVKAIAREELATRSTEPSFLAERALRRALYRGHPYAAVAPSEAVIDALTPETLRTAARRRLSPPRAILFVVGSVEAPEIARAASRSFAAWTADGPDPIPPLRVPSRAPGLAITVVPRPGSVQTVLLAGTIAPPRAAENAAPLVLANAIFGGAFSSRLVENLREEKGYTYSPGSSLWFRRCGGPLSVWAAVRNEVTGAALNEILYEVRRMATTDVTSEELERARAREAGVLAISIQTHASLAMELARLAADGLGAGALTEQMARLYACTGEEVRAAAFRHLAGPGLQVVAVGERETIRRELAPFGTEVVEEIP